MARLQIGRVAPTEFGHVALVRALWPGRDGYGLFPVVFTELEECGWDAVLQCAAGKVSCVLGVEKRGRRNVADGQHHSACGKLRE